MEPTGRHRSHDPFFGRSSTDSQSYNLSSNFARPARAEFPSPDPMPLFLSDPDGEPDPREFTSPSERVRKTGWVTYVSVGVLAVSAMGALVALFQSDVTRMLMASAKASIGAAVADRSATQPSSNQPVARQIPSKDTARVTGPLMLARTDARNSPPSTPPSREAIVTAYQSALQNPTPQAELTAAPAVAKTIDADTLASLINRARNLIAVGDIAAARLLLERAANAQDANAAFLLAQTYDPVVLGTRDTRSIAPDPAMARDWYEKAARLGASEAQTRLTQLQN